MEYSTADSFSAYLAAKQKERPASATPIAGGTAFSLLVVLAEEPQQAIPLTDLQKAGGMSFLDFSQSIERLVKSGYLITSGEPGGEIARLTRLGSDVASLARSA